MWNVNIRSLDPSVSPIRAALSAWGLSIDDIKVASFHGTSTKANDINESQLINDQMRHLGRSPGHPLLVVCQKYLTGHSKGAAAAWQLNGCMQMLESGIVPGNRNADDVDAALQEFEHLVYPSEAVDCSAVGVKACMLTSFGFGQKGGIVVAVSPRLLFAAFTPEQYRNYQERVATDRSSIPAGDDGECRVPGKGAFGVGGCGKARSLGVPGSKRFVGLAVPVQSPP